MQTCRKATLSLAVSAAVFILAACASYAAADCGFSLGFKAMHDLIPEVVGNCLENEHHNPANGDGLQRTTGGLLVWRKADNWTAFTDGATTWINGPNGLQSRPNGERFSWESDVSQPSPWESNPLVQRAIDDAVQRTGVERSAVRVVSVESREWGDASLGCPQPDRMYAQVITPGFLIVLEAAGTRLEYHTDSSRRVEFCR
jgi:hypothetical protein